MRTPEERAALMAQVRENLARLEACPGHAFLTPVGEPWVTCADGTPLYQRYRCVSCQGEVDSIAKSWYEQGHAHGRQAREA